jgi:hypothetical protein
MAQESNHPSEDGFLKIDAAPLRYRGMPRPPYGATGHRKRAVDTRTPPPFLPTLPVIAPTDNPF